MKKAFQAHVDAMEALGEMCERVPAVIAAVMSIGGGEGG